MKKLLILISGLALLSCQRSYIQESNELNVQSSKTNKFMSMNNNVHKMNLDLKGVHKMNDDEMLFHNQIHLVTHNQFMFLEFVDAEIDPNNPGMKEISDDYELYSGSCHIYEVEADEISRDHDLMIGRAFQLNNHNRDQVSAVVEKIVIVNDAYAELPYYAAVLTIQDETWIYYGWTSGVGAMNYPFMDKGTYFEEEANERVLSAFQNSVEYSRFEDTKARLEQYDYEETSVHELEHFNGTKYYVVQYNTIGGCGSLMDNLTAVYSEKKGKLKLIAMDELEYYFQDMVDVNGDGYPEFIGAEFSASAIFSISKGRLNLLQQIDWSIDECPC